MAATAAPVKPAAVTYPAGYPVRAMLAEERILANLLLGGITELRHVMTRLSSSSFVGTGHAELFSAIVGMGARYPKSLEWDTNRLLAYLRQRGAMRGPITTAYLAGLSCWAPYCFDKAIIEEDIQRLYETNEAVHNESAQKTETKQEAVNAH